MDETMAERLPPGAHVIGPAQQKSAEIPIRHRLNPKAEVTYTPLSDQVGMKRAAVAMGRLAPGRESFVAHAHAVQEEFVYILSGRGTMEIAGEKIPVNAGDFIGFPTDGLAHNLINTGEDELSYLMGGERTSHDFVTFPHLDKVMITKTDGLQLFDEKAGQSFSFQEWIKRE